MKYYLLFLTILVGCVNLSLGGSEIDEVLELSDLKSVNSYPNLDENIVSSTEIVVRNDISDLTRILSNRVDSNFDNLISMGEIKSVEGKKLYILAYKLDSFFIKNFDNIDLNSDGLLSYLELNKASLLDVK